MKMKTVNQKWISVKEQIPAIGEFVKIMYEEEEDGDWQIEIDEFTGLHPFCECWFYDGCVVEFWKHSTKEDYDKQ